MKLRPIFKIKIENGKMEWERPELWEQFLGMVNGKFELFIRPEKRLRTTGKYGEPSNQNGRYWKLVVELFAEDLGIMKLEAHELLKLNCNSRMIEKKMPDGCVKRIIIGGSTKRMNRMDFAEYCKKCEIFIQTEFNIFVPDVDKVDIV